MGLINHENSKFNFFLDLNKNNSQFSKKNIIIKDNIILYISSTDENFINKIDKNITNNIYHIDKYYFTILRTQIQQFEYDSKSYYLKLLTPCVIQDSNNKCLSPNDINFEKYFRNNLSRKLNCDFNFMILDNKVKKKIIETKNGGKVTGYLYDIFITVEDNSTISNILENGIGAKNNFGFGFLQIIKSI
jgi:CRISPR-associated endoribonuclease Cas6